MDLMNQESKVKNNARKAVIVVLAVVAVFAAVLGLSSISSNKPEPTAQDKRAKLQVARILLEEKAEFISGEALVQGCLARIQSQPELVAKLLEDPRICIETINPLILRMLNGSDGVCKLGDGHCAFASGYIRVVTLTNQRPRTPEELEQLNSVIEDEFQKYSQQKGQ